MPGYKRSSSGLPNDSSCTSRSYSNKPKSLSNHNPLLPYGGKPDFLVRDTKGNSCYLDAKVYYNSRTDIEHGRELIAKQMLSMEAVNGMSITFDYDPHEKQSPDPNNEIQNIAEC